MTGWDMFLAVAGLVGGLAGFLSLIVYLLTRNHHQGES